MKGFIVFPTYQITGGRARVQLFGRLENGESFVTIHDFKPYFAIKKADREKAEAIVKEIGAKSITISETELTDFDREDVVKVELLIPREVPELKRLFIDKGIACYEADIRFSYRFLIDHGIKACMEIDGKHRTPGKDEELLVDRVYENPRISPAEFWPKLKVLSIDIETSLDGKELYAIGLYTDGYEEVLFRSDKTLRHARGFPDEKSMLAAFTAAVRRLDPDVITGWNVIDFDFKTLQAFCRKHQVPFVIGRTDRETALRITESYYTDSSAVVAGRAVLDGIHLVKTSFLRLEDYKLNTAAKEILGEEKLLQGQGRHTEIERLFKEDPQRLVDYNLRDARLVYDILGKSDLLDLTIRRSMLTRMQLERVNASIASLDSLYLEECRKRGFVCPSVGESEREERIKGGFVMESKPGIYEGIIVLDFKSLYPSVMRTFNIDPVSFVPTEKYRHMSEAEKEGLIEAPNGAHFRKEQGILPDLLQRLWKQRDHAKKRNDELASQAIKILMNSMFGVLANPNCRFYSIELANSITHFGQYLIKLTRDQIEEMGYTVIYGDTDSIFVDIKNEDLTEIRKIGHKIEQTVNIYYTGYVKEAYGRESFLELEFEKTFVKFLMPRVRGSESGAKKRYAGMTPEGKIIIVGLEFVRRDWTAVAKTFQMGLLEHLFHDKSYDSYIQDFVAELRAGKMDDALIYKKAIRKNVSEYTKTTPPHVKAARILGREQPGIIEYVMTANGPEPVEKKTSALDYDHYIEKQIKPIADAILSFQDRSFEELIAGSKQTGLGDFG